MSAPLPTIASVTAPAPVPVSVRNGSSGARGAYETALDFEKLLVGQLSQELVKDSGLGGEGETSGEGSGEAVASGQAGGDLPSALVPTALTESLTAQGGLGLAGQLLAALDPAATAGPQSISATTGGSPPEVPASTAPAAGVDSQPADAVGASGGVSA
jgi:hypothetical protein